MIRARSLLRHAALAHRVILGFVVGGCSLVVGDLPGPLNDDAGSVTAGSSSGGSASGGEPTDLADGEAPAPGGTANGSSGGSSGPADAQVDPESDADATDVCDRDGDGEDSEECGGEDCDDDDDEVFSTQDRYFELASKHKGFDYNCNGSTEREYPDPLSCDMALSLCDMDEQGFLDAPLPLCGEQGNWGHCAAMQVGAVPTPTCTQSQPDEMRRVACR